MHLLNTDELGNSFSHCRSSHNLILGTGSRSCYKVPVQFMGDKLVTMTTAYASFCIDTCKDTCTSAPLWRALSAEEIPSSNLAFRKNCYWLANFL